MSEVRKPRLKAATVRGGSIALLAMLLQIILPVVLADISANSAELDPLETTVICTPNGLITIADNDTGDKEDDDSQIDCPLCQLRETVIWAQLGDDTALPVPPMAATPRPIELRSHVKLQPWAFDRPTRGPPA